MSGTNPHSNYWKINHQEDDDGVSRSTSAFHIPSNTAFSRDQETVAVAANVLTENLKIFQLAENSLVHLASITLPDVQSLKFLRPISPPTQDFKFLATGHSDGIAHLSAIPLTDNSVFENAEIIKRFNHKKHLRAEPAAGKTPACLNDGTLSTTISSMQLTGPAWRSTSLNSLVSVYDHHLFMWDTSRSRAPLSLFRTNGISRVALNDHIDSLAAIVGDFGLSLLDMRTGKNQSKSSLYLPPTCSSPSLPSRYGAPKGVICVEWCETNENFIATLQNDVVYIWDIRKLEPLTELTGFSDSVTQVKWSGDNLWTGDKDGYLTNWNLKNVHALQKKRCLVSHQNTLADLWENFNLDDKPSNNTVFCGTGTKVSNSKIVSLDLDVSGSSVVCLDGSFLSTHDIKVLNKASQPAETMSRRVSNAKRSKRPAPIYVGPERIVSTESFSSSGSNSSSPLFDTGLDSRKTSNNISFPPSPTSDTKKSTVSKDYLEYFQKEIDTMLKSMDTKRVDDRVYI